MKKIRSLSNVSKDYLYSYNCILDEMIQKMTEAELTDSISSNFIILMIPHHKAAIDMSQNILRYTTNISLQEIAQNIINEQTKNIENMYSITRICSRSVNSKRDLEIYQHKTSQIIQTMFSRMENSKVSNQINCDFMWEMIPHHMGAIEMSTSTLMFKICSELIPILETIMSSQKKYIIQMQDLLNCINYE